MELNDILFRAVELGASDIHLKVAQCPMVRRDGGIEPIAETEPLTHATLARFLDSLANTSEQRAAFDSTGELDLAYAVDGLPRFRVNVFRQRGAISMALRVIPRQIPSLDDLRMPVGVRRLGEFHHGLVLVTGATGAGKSTTLAAVVDYINRTRRQHIVTIEDPIELLHPDRGCIVNQREVGIDTGSFREALRRALRQDPDVILIGELRDAETAETALQAAESGHLVLSTMHTIDAAETISRMIEFFPAVKQPMIRSIIAGVLRAVVSQRLLPALNGGRVAAVEVMITNERIAELIRADATDDVPRAIEEGAFFEMQTLSKALIEHVLNGTIERETAANVAPNRHDFLLALERAEKALAAAATEPAMASRQKAEQPAPKPPDDAVVASGLRLVGSASSDRLGAR